MSEISKSMEAEYIKDLARLITELRNEGYGDYYIAKAIFRRRW